jgi:hypothetical protein
MFEQDETDPILVDRKQEQHEEPIKEEVEKYVVQKLPAPQKLTL